MAHLRVTAAATPRVHRTLVLGALGAALIGCAGAAAPPPWWSASGVTSCGYPAHYRAAGQVHPAGDCAGNLFDPAVAVTLRIGEVVDIHMTEEQSTGSSSLVPLYPLPSSSDPTVLRRTGGDGDATASYRAEAPGTAQLRSPAPFCTDTSTGGQSSRPCPVLTVTVTG